MRIGVLRTFAFTLGTTLGTFGTPGTIGTPLGTRAGTPGTLGTPLFAQAPTPTVVESPNVKVLTGLYAQQFQEEMNFMVQALGVTCNTCHVPRNFASEDKPLKQKARQMLEMTAALNKQYFPDHKPKDGESVLGRVTCYTCHKGEQLPKTAVGQ